MSYIQTGGGGGSGTVTNANTLVNGDFITGSSATAIVDTGIPFYLDPTKYLWYYDDFISGQNLTSSGIIAGASGAGIGWMQVVGGSSSFIITSPADAGTQGSALITTGATSGNFVTLYSGKTVSSTPSPSLIALNGTTFDYKTRLKISATTTITARFGFNDNTNNNRIEIQYDTAAADATWNAICTAGGTPTKTVITGATLDTSYHTFRIRSAVAGTILFSVDGGAEISIATNVPSLSLGIDYAVTTNANSARSASIDYIWGWVAITR